MSNEDQNKMLGYNYGQRLIENTNFEKFGACDNNLEISYMTEMNKHTRCGSSIFEE